MLGLASYVCVCVFLKAAYIVIKGHKAVFYSPLTLRYPGYFTPSEPYKITQNYEF